MSLLWVASWWAGDPTGGAGEGVYAATLDAVTGTLGGLELAAETSRPSWLALHPSGRVLYALDAGDDEHRGAVTAFAVGPGAQLRALATVPSGGAEPCHAVPDPAGSSLVVCHYGGAGQGGLARVPLDAAGLPRGPGRAVVRPGSGPVAGRQEHSHPHSALLSADGSRLLVADLGADRLHVTSPAGDAPLEGGVALAPGTGPRSLAHGPPPYAYATGELDGTLTVLGWEAGEPAPRVVATTCATAGPPQPGDAVAEVVVDAGAGLVLVSVRGSDRIGVHALRDGGARLEPLADVASGGACPRHLALVDGLLVVANQASGELVALRVDPATGAARTTGVLTGVPHPVCVLAVPAPAPTLVR